MSLKRLSLVVGGALLLGGAGAGGVYWSPAAPGRGGQEEAAAQPRQAPVKEVRPGALFGQIERPASDDTDRIQGTWVAESVETGGRRAADAKLTLVIAGDRVTFDPDAEKREATFKLYPARKPKTISLIPQRGPVQSNVITGLYALDEDRLRLCFDNGEGKLTPTEFATRPGTDLTLLVLKRSEATAVRPGVRTLRIAAGFVGSLAFSPDGKVLAGAAGSSDLYFWDTASGRTLSIVRDSATKTSGSGQAVAFSPDGRLVAFAEVETGPPGGMFGPGAILPARVRLLDAATGRIVTALPAKNVSSVAFLPDGKSVVSASSDGDTTLWDVATGRVKFSTKREPQGRAARVAVAPDGKVLAVSGTQVITLLDATTGKKLADLSGSSQHLYAVAFAPDGRWLAAARASGDVILFEVASRKEIRHFLSSSKHLVTLAFSPDGKFLATGGIDKIVRLWDIATGKEVTAFTGHTEAVTSVAFAPDGRTLASASTDGTVKLWDLKK